MSEQPTIRRHRGAVTNSGSVPVTVWIPSSLAEKIDAAVVESDTDRSKFVRTALREKLRALKPSTATA